MNRNELSLMLYKKLFLIRRSEELIIHYYPENEMKTPMHMSMGQEANAVGVCEALDPRDQIFGTYRSHALFLTKTDDPDMFFSELYGRATGTAKGKAGSMHLACPEKSVFCSSAIVAGCISVAVGSAFANKRKRNGRISCVFFGDGAVDEGSFWESMNIACVMGLPVLFVCEDNNYAVHTHKKTRQGYTSLTDIIEKFECNVFIKDTTDVEEIYRSAKEAIQSITLSGKPSFMYLSCYRYLQHVGVLDDFGVGYRSKAEFDEWFGRDCIKVQRSRLLDAGYSEDEITRIESDISTRIEKSIQKAKNEPFPKTDTIYHGVFYEKNQLL